jgi:hypothetical protein
MEKGDNTVMIVKATDLSKIFDQLSILTEEVKKLTTQENNRAVSISEAAEMLGLHYNSVRRLIIKDKLFAKYLNNDYGRTVIPLWTIKEWLSKN